MAFHTLSASTTDGMIAEGAVVDDDDDGAVVVDGDDDGAATATMAASPLLSLQRR